jgi:hypothetical protein
MARPLLEQVVVTPYGLATLLRANNLHSPVEGMHTAAGDAKERMVAT